MFWANIFIAVYLFHITNTYASVSRDSKLQHGIFYRRFRNIKWALHNTLLEIIYVKNLYECSIRCIGNFNCKAFHIDEGPPQGDTRACELLAKDGAYALWEYFSYTANISYYDTHQEYLRTCKMQYKYDGHFTSDLYYLKGDPAASGTIGVHCEISGSQIKTIFDVTSTKVISVTGHQNPASFTLNLQYNGDINQAGRVAESSTSCQQWAYASCYGSNVNWNAGIPNLLAQSRYNNDIGYWGGGNSQKYCGCGVSGNCADGGECNCNGYIGSRSDYGYYTDKSILPLSRVKVGDTHYNSGIFGLFGAYQRSQYISMGNLECYVIG